MTRAADWMDDDDLHPEGPSQADLERFDADSDTCPSCGSEVYADTALCPICGTAIGDRIDAGAGGPKPWIVAIVLVLVLTFVGLGVVLY